MLYHNYTYQGYDLNSPPENFIISSYYLHEHNVFGIFIIDEMIYSFLISTKISYNTHTLLLHYNNYNYSYRLKQMLFYVANAQVNT